MRSRKDLTTARLRIVQVRSQIGNQGRVRRVLTDGLGLGRIGSSVVLPDNSYTRGMIAKVAHIVSFEELAAEPGVARAAERPRKVEERAPAPVVVERPAPAAVAPAPAAVAPAPVAVAPAPTPEAGGGTEPKPAAQPPKVATPAVKKPARPTRPPKTAKPAASKPGKPAAAAKRTKAAKPAASRTKTAKDKAKPAGKTTAKPAAKPAAKRGAKKGKE
jgi:ribosomal protein L30